MGLGMIVAVAAFLFILSQKKTNPEVLSSNDTQNADDAHKEPQVKEYTDPAGFSFSYPDSLTLEKQEADETTYSSIELTSDPGEKPIAILVKDSEVPSLASWLSKNVLPADVSKSKTLKLGDLEARQTVTTDGLTSVALDQNVLFTITLPPNSSETTVKAYNLITATFVLKPPEIQPAQETSSGIEDNAVEFEGEEVIE